MYCYLHIIKDLFFVTNTNYVFGRRHTMSAFHVISDILEFIYI